VSVGLVDMKKATGDLLPQVTARICGRMEAAVSSERLGQSDYMASRQNTELPVAIITVVRT